MSLDQEHRLEEVFSAARKLPPLERAAFLEQACGGDVELRRQADSLFAVHDQVGQFLQPTVALSTPNVFVGRSGDRIGHYTPVKKIWKSGSTRPLLQLALFQVMLLALTCLLTGCVGVLPFPQFSNQPMHGTKLRAKDTAFVRLGTTSASELFGTLGTNCLCDPRKRAVAFSWELPGGRGVWWWALAATTVAGGGGEFEWSRWRAFFVAFDTNNVVTAANTKHLSSSKTLHEHLEAWARKHHVAPDHIHPEMFVAKDP